MEIQQAGVQRLLNDELRLGRGAEKSLLSHEFSGLPQANLHLSISVLHQQNGTIRGVSQCYWKGVRSQGVDSKHFVQWECNREQLLGGLDVVLTVFQHHNSHLCHLPWDFCRKWLILSCKSITFLDPVPFLTIESNLQLRATFDMPLQIVPNADVSSATQKKMLQWHLHKLPEMRLWQCPWFYVIWERKVTKKN